jgi:uncharacterized surface protein with fasciclin (FAS1) repeats
MQERIDKMLKFGLKNKATLLLVALVLLMGIVPAVSAQSEYSRVRVTHLSPDTPAVEVFLNGASSGIQVLNFRDTSGWVELPAGTYSVAVAPYGAGIDAAAIGPVSLSLQPGGWTTIAATGSLTAGTLGADVISEDYTPLNADQARVTVFHGIEDAPAVDVILPDGTKVVSNLSFGNARTVTVPQGTYNLAVVPAGATSPTVINLAGTELAGGTFYFVAAANRLAAPGVALEVVPQSVVAPLFDKVSASGSIAAIAAADGRFDTLVAAVTAAGLAETLSGPGSFTVFAPTDAAFAKLPAGTLDAVLADQELLTNILLYHVVAGRAPSTEIVNLPSVNALRGGAIKVTVNDQGVFLNDNVRVIITDIPATNGVIHVIDTVLIP